MKNDVTIILDKSGSMNSIKEDVIDEFNLFVKEHKEVNAKSRFSLVQFNNEIENIFSNERPDKIKNLNEKLYVPNGSTSLLDAIGFTLNSTIKRLKSKKLRNVIIAIITDGRENSSTEFDLFEIKKLVNSCQNELGWNILFLAAKQDAFFEGSKMGFNLDNCKNIKFSKKGLGLAFDMAKKYYN